MKKALFVAGIVACSALQTYAQGQFNFSNSGITPAAPVYVDVVGGSVKTDNTYSFDYVYAKGSVTEGLTSTQLTAPKTGLSGGLFLGGTQTIPSYTGVISLQIRAWKTSAGSYDNASTTVGLYSGKSSVMQIPLGDPTASPPGTATKLSGYMTSFAVVPTVPEPSTIALGVMGLSLLAFRRRK